MERAPALAWLLGHRVQRVDGPRPGLLTLTFYERGEKQTLLLAFGLQRGVGALDERPKGEAANAFIQRLRTQLEGGRLRGAEWLLARDAERAVALQLAFERADNRARIVVDFDGSTPNLFLLRDDDTVAGAADERSRRARFADKKRPYEPGQGKGIAIPADAQALREAGSKLADPASPEAGDPIRNAARSQLRAALKKAERKLSAIEGDLARVAETPRLRREGNVLLSHLDEVPRGVSQVRLFDDSAEDWIEIALDPAQDARRAAELRFERARKIERGLAIAGQRRDLAQHEVDRLRATLAELEAAPPERISELARDLGIAANPRRRPQQRARVPFRTFRAAHGEPIFVGKNAADNDTLTLTVARPHDHWLHVRGSAGSHVVVPLEKKAQIAPELLLDAATLAAHFSQQRGEPTFEIAHTERRFVRKLKGSAPGSVNVDRERVFVLRFESARLTRLLASEKA
ncbi:MAG TPA: NFACT RNA binding domain-containing protein [Polyangiales bacterium]|nr:NFACT RNA binding domain-containing protein [Polyangiales bacterium]